MDFLYGHRGASLSYPENTMEAFRAALDGGANAIETDVRISCDGEVVIFHDPTAERIAGHGRSVEDHSLRDVQQWDVGWGFVDSAGNRPFAGQGI
ncbi:MAG: glycerophosphodiester phosphodiesterase family protein, partial [Myxococcota bacterium]|nr:glycerophosphodiester phosphodiesterase family protein [Myxococcota bacterium]